MKIPPPHQNEFERKQALDRLKVLDTPPEAVLDQITELAASICETKIALISLVDTDRQWFKSCYGMDAKQTHRNISFCGHAILQNEIFTVEDASCHPDFSDNPLVTSGIKIRFYAGAPLQTRDGYALGTLCVIDDKPKILTDLQKKILKSLAAQVVLTLESQLNSESLKKAFNKMQEAEKIAKIGSWHYDFSTKEQSWSSEHYRIFEIEEPQPADKLFSLYRERIHPDDLPELDRIMKRAVEEGKDFVYDHRVYLDQGKKIKYVQGIGKVTKDALGKPIIMSGTCRDKTDDVESESRFRKLIETMSEGLVVQDSSGKIIQYNQATLETLAMSPDQLLGKTSMDPKWRAIREDRTDFPGDQHPSMIALKTGKPVVGVIMGLNLPSGDLKWIRINASPSETKNGRQVMVTFSDITKLVEVKKENRFILDSLGIGIWKFDVVTQHLEWDESLYTLYEIDPKDFSGHYHAWESTLTPEAKAQAIQDLESALKGEKEFNTTFEIITPSGKRKQIGGKGTVIRDENRRPIKMYGINWDRTREVEMEKDLQMERSKAIHNAKLASMGEMSAGVAHEINNPLAIVMGNLQLLNRHRDHPVLFQEKVAIIAKAAERIAKIVSGLKKFSRSSSNVHQEPQSLTQIIHEALTLTNVYAKQFFIQVQSEIEKDFIIHCDVVEMEQVLINLIHNAIDAVKPNTESERWIKVRAFQRQNHAIIQVIDSGHGISKSVEEKLFQPFFTTKAVGEGTGLGLSIAKGILDRHEATLILNRSMPNTCFEVSFPLER